MGQIKNIKLHIVTDIKVKALCRWSCLRIFPTMVEEHKTEETAEVIEAGKTVDENGEDEKPAVNGDDNHAEGETNGDEKKPTENGDDDDDGESSEEELGLLEKPIEILTSKRVRKSVDAYVEKVKETKEEDFDYSKGGGLKLGDIPFIKHNIDRADTEDLTVLHRMMYRRVGRANFVKKNIREFCGWPFDEESKEFKSIRSNVIDRLLKEAMKWTLNLLGLDKTDDMEENRNTLVEFLKKPVMIEKEVPKRTSTGGKKKSKTPKKKTPKAKKKKSKETVKDSGDDSDVSEASSNDDSSDEEEDEKPKKTPAKKTGSAKKSPKGGTPVKISLPVKKGSSKKKRKSTASSDSEDEEPLKKKGNKPPTDAELKKVVSAILKDADLETVTMKNVVKQVYDKYTSFDLTDRKDFIKSTVKDLIS